MDAISMYIRIEPMGLGQWYSDIQLGHGDKVMDIKDTQVRKKVSISKQVAHR